ncbi:MAG: GTP 3',8-cyclase MoaA [Bacillota bacterium]
MELLDNFGRIHNYLRVSLTDRCNLNCSYCNPLRDNSAKMNRTEMLSFDELSRLLVLFLSELGIRKIRFTGGEPFVRKEIINFFRSVGRLKSKYDFEFALTTNGTLLKDHLAELKSIGLDKLNISLDSLKPYTFRYLTGSNKLQDVIDAVNIAGETGFSSLKINTVILKGINDNEIIDFVNFIKNRPVTLRFIEYMPFGNNSWDDKKFISAKDVKQIIEKCFDITKVADEPDSVAESYKLSNFIGKVGFISPVSDHFCTSCSRLRLKANGTMKLCLFSDPAEEIDLKKYLRSGYASNQELKEIIFNSLRLKKLQHASVEELLRSGTSNMTETGG